jgi:hypothetical protein
VVDVPGVDVVDEPPDGLAGGVRRLGQPALFLFCAQA